MEQAGILVKSLSAGMRTYCQVITRFHYDVHLVSCDCAGRTHDELAVRLSGIYLRQLLSQLLCLELLHDSVKTSFRHCMCTRYLASLQAGTPVIIIVPVVIVFAAVLQVK